MCGINGILVKSDDLNIRGILTKMNNKIIHRGPDDEGYLTEIATNYSIGMSMRRLAVLDILSGQQPIYSNDKQKVIVYNGEIYNHQSLKNILKEKGYQFSTKSDTE